MSHRIDFLDALFLISVVALFAVFIVAFAR